MAHYLITGGAGFIGSHLGEALLKEGHHLTVIDDLSTGKKENLHSSIRLIIEDAGNPTLLKEIIPQMDGVYHLAAIASVQRSREAWAATTRVNLLASVALLDAIAASTKRIPFVYASSAAVYGNASQHPISEECPPAPLTAYGVDKWATEQHAAIGAALHDIPSTGLRFFNVYGQRQDASSPYSGVISLFMDKAKQRKPLGIFGDGTQSRDFVYVKDVVRGLINAMQAHHTRQQSEAIRCNLCTGIATSISELAEFICYNQGMAPDIRYHPARAGDIYQSVGDTTRMRAYLGLSEMTRLKDGLKEMRA